MTCLDTVIWEKLIPDESDQQPVKIFPLSVWIKSLSVSEHWGTWARQCNAHNWTQWPEGSLPT